MHRIADHFHLVVLIKQECLESDILWKFVQLVQSAVPIDADRTVEVVAFQDVPQLTVVFWLEDEDERNVAVCCRIDMGDQLLPFRQLQFATGTPDRIDVNQHFIFRIGYPIVHRLGDKTGERHILWKDDLFPLPFLNQQGELFFVILFTSG